MNHKCCGDFYLVNGRSFYRCFLDSTVLYGPRVTNVCPNCGRLCSPLQHGEVPTRETIEVYYDQQWHVHQIGSGNQGTDAKPADGTRRSEAKD